ncbi:MAG: calcium/sodium antiporter, partial [Bacteroidales bacterium]|nr:calcium/sodium antiporter [Bacteroidales bacterium]
MLLNIGLIVLGLVFLVKGGDFLVDGATAIARKAKVSEMVIGLTIVGFGTSTPELLVSLQAALEGSSGLAIGNVVGSNIANIALILGVTALIVPCPTDKKTVFLDMGVMLFAIFAFTAVALTGTISRTAGIVGFLILVGYVIFQIASSKTEQISDLQENVSTNNPKWKTSLWISLLLIVLGGVLLIYGAKFLVRGASEIARQIGERRGTPAVEMERIIGLTIVAVGTSLPELFASIMAAVKGKTDMAIGNIIGSVTFNILSVIGLSAAITPIYDTRDGFVTDYALMAALGVILWIFLHSRF